MCPENLANEVEQFNQKVPPSRDQEILVIEGLSSGLMYIHEIIERGYKALLVNPDAPDPHVTEHKAASAKKLAEMYSPEQFEFMEAPFDAEVIYNMVKDHNIVCCVPGSEYGVKLADYVGAKLNLPHNDPSTTWRRCTKSGMTESLEEAGIRAIKTAKVTCVQDIVDFWNDNNITKAFMKFAEGAAGSGVKACETLEEAIEHYEKVKNTANYFGNTDDDILIQEFIGGDEYVVNTVSCQGQHIVSDMWKYTKVISPDGEVLYQSSRLIDELDEELEDLVAYAFQVLDAVDLKYGPCHGEYKIDHNGPVLIETNCRPMGDSTTRDFMLDISGQCIVDWSLDSYMNQEDFLEKIAKNEPYHSIQSSIKKYVILYKPMHGDMSAHFYLAEQLKSFHNHNDYEAMGETDYPQTTDLGNTPMILKLAYKNLEDVQHDVKLMNMIEQKYPELVVCPNKVLQAGEKPKTEDVDHYFKQSVDLVARADKCERTLLLTPDEAYEVCKGKYTPVSEETPKIFDNVIYANSSSGTLLDKYKEIFGLFKYLKPGGKAYICDCAAEVLPYGKDCFEVLKLAAGIKTF